MSTDLRDSNYLAVTRFFGGEKGTCIQLTGRQPDGQVGWFAVTLDEFREFAEWLSGWAAADRDRR